MTVAELRDLLSKVPQELSVYIGYDSMVVVEEIENDNNNIIIEQGPERGVYLCAQSAMADWMITPESESAYVGGKLLKDMP